ncbi:reprolysin-like metallopeptidase [Hymenobacter psychrophilus]|uniref:Por secretion system C-terminal sorting domain-containing protein n=1 Tax=Hymenobacter psychrophilus TaxID=651662 RepID=A0A1H3FF73_9BACT|nr:zinc-dependent metalloprotease family protein [Hymenobacter psychrophilus]SDX89525.1 Por secretion system C-terminal sorting domain-containing protein [Hymenobacter psychrophilus]
MQLLSTLLRQTWRPLLAGSALLLAGSSAAQAQRVLWADAPQVPAQARAATQALSHFRSVSFQLDAVREALKTAPLERTGNRGPATVISLPLPNGTSQRFRVEQVPVMAPALAARYPSIRTYVAQGLDDPSATARLDITPAGFHAQILAVGYTVYIDPTAKGSSTHLVFERRNMLMPAFTCAVPAPDGNEPEIKLSAAQRAAVANGTTLRTYRLALAATAEYSAFHGGTKESVMAAFATTMNRINGIYEREVAVRMVIVPKNDTLIFFDADTDPYTNNNGSAMLNQNQTTVDTRIGNANYDIGHVFSTNGGGVAQKPSVCINTGKARGVTGTNSPIGDAFDVDYVAHEMGHQFGGDHTFNSQTGSCGGGNRAAVSAYEPGSGTTIMAYAGICGADNTQPNSDAFFHSRSFDQIVAHITRAQDCSAATATGNTAPAVNAGRNYAIPVRTPFTLTGSATDANNDALTYSWEQYNLGPAGAPNAPEGDAPLFRTFSPTTSPSRTFPRLSDILNNTQTRGELLPTYGRRLIFRLVARDNRTGGGGVDYDSMNVVVVPTAGPFVVTAPNSANTNWLVGSPQQVSWDVANTTQAPISAANVDILLSTDGGLTFPTTLLANTPNDGYETLTLPASVAATAQARIKVQATGGIFFDVSDRNFKIDVPTGPTFFLQGPAGPASALRFCAGNSGTVALTVGQLQGFTGPVTLAATNLPAGVTVTFPAATVAAGTSTTATITAAGTTAAGTYTLQLTGVSGTDTRTLDVPLTILPGITQAPTITAPTTASTRTTLRPLISWSPVPDATGYEVQLALDAAFTTGVITQTISPANSFVPNQLQASTQYFVRVRAVGGCGAGPYSAVTNFTTGTQTCQTLAATNVPLTISATGTSTVTSIIAVTSTNRTSNIRVRNLAITHPDVSELEISLTNPAGRRVVLFTGNCSGANLNLSFDDAATAAIACPLVAGTTVRPLNSFGELLNQPANGNWTLTIIDSKPGNGGTLTGWSLEVCTSDELPLAPTSLTALAPMATATGADIDLIWLDNATNETGYEIERALAPSTTFTKVGTVAAGSTFFTDKVTTNGQLCYRVRAINTAGASAYSNQACQTVSVITRAVAAALQGIEVAPNPSTGLFRVRIGNDQRGPVTLRVTDAVGRVVKTQTLTKGAAELQTSLDLSPLGTGIYQLHLDLPNGTSVVRLLKQ